MLATVAEQPGRERLTTTVWAALKAPASAIGLGMLALATITLTYLTIYGYMPFAPTPAIVVGLVVANFILVLILAALTAVRMADIWNQRRAGVMQSRLHARLVAIFSAIAIIPAALTAAFAAFTITLGMEAWFSKGVRTALDNSLAVAQGYLGEHRRNIRADALALGNDLNLRASEVLNLLQTDPAGLASYLFKNAGQRAIDGVAIYNAKKLPLVSVTPGFVLAVDRPDDQDYDTARRGEVSLTTEENGSQVRAFVQLSALPDLYLMVVRNVDSKVIGYQQETQRVIDDFRRLEASRTGAQITLGLVYASVALVLLIASVFAGMWAASRIVAPIGRLVGASDRVSRGDLTARVPVDRSDDELATLSLAFNRMTGELESQREELIESHRQTEVRRRFTEAVLSGVSAGVIGLDGDGRINILNRSAQAMLGLSRDPVIGLAIGEVATELAPLV
ncbi:MAG TPA: two-component sensor histidine kinase, partial [Alphaproteobacteria bacterium]|nr:two-component sensor histidine kinase [Alphaproteobacteria bacterium]